MLGLGPGSSRFSGVRNSKCGALRLADDQSGPTPHATGFPQRSKAVIEAVDRHRERTLLGRLRFNPKVGDEGSMASGEVSRHLHVVNDPLELLEAAYRAVLQLIALVCHGVDVPRETRLGLSVGGLKRAGRI